MTDQEIIAVVAKLLQRSRVGEFGMVGNRKPAIYVKTNPFSVEIGNVFLGRQKAVAVADGILTIRPQALGWVLAGDSIKLPRPSVARVTRQPIRRKTWEVRRAEYLREVGREKQKEGLVAA